MTIFKFLWPYKQKNCIYFLAYLEISGALDKKNILIAYESNNPQIFYGTRTMGKKALYKL